MKVLLFVTAFSFEYMISFANGLSKFCEVVLLMPDKGLSKIHRENINSEVKLRTYRLHRIRSPLNIFLMRHLNDIVGDENPDILHIQNNGHRWSFLQLPFIKGIPIVNTVHDPFPHLGDKNSKGYSLSKFVAKACTSHYIVHGEKMKESLVKLYSIDSNSVDVIPHGNLDIYKKWEISKKVKQEESMLFFGRIWRYKGLHQLIKANNMLKKNNISYKLVIAGTGEDINIYKDLISDNRDYVFKNYFISNSDIPDLFRKSSFVVLPYIEATQSGVIALAYSFGKPVIATNVGSMSEYVKNGESGIIVEPNNITKLCAAIKLLIENRELRDKLSKGAKKMASRDLHWSNIGKTTSEIYDKILRKN